MHNGGHQLKVSKIGTLPSMMTVHRSACSLMLHRPVLTLRLYCSRALSQRNHNSLAPIDNLIFRYVKIPSVSLPLGSNVVLACTILMAGCDGAQSDLEPAGRSAEKIANLFWWMTAGAAVIWGAVVPTVVLSLLLAYGLSMMPEMLSPAPEGSLKIAVTGEQWWWRVSYESPNGEPIALANEIHLHVGQPVEFRLESADVIHSVLDSFPWRQG